MADCEGKLTAGSTLGLCNTSRGCSKVTMPPQNTAPGTAHAISNHQEIETKLAAGPQVPIPSLRTVPGVARVGDPKTFELDATYFDTSELDLLQARLTLRRRTGGTDAGWHLKMPAAAGRTELTVALDASADIFTVPNELAQIVYGAARGAVLAPVARVHTTRTSVSLFDEAGTEVLEIADDQVTAGPAVSDGEQQTCWREIEVEIVGGTYEQLESAVDKILQAGATPSQSVSKLGAALAAAGRRPTRRPSFQTPANRRTDAHLVVIGGLSRYRNALVEGDIALRLGSPGAAERTRTILRKLRSALSVYASMFHPEPVRTLAKELKALHKLLGPIRDGDVLLSRLEVELSEEPSDFAAQARGVMHARIAEDRQRAVDRLTVWLEGPRLLQLLRDLDSFIADAPMAGTRFVPAGRVLPALVASSWSRVRKQADIALAAPDDPVRLDRVRRSATSVRYAAELAGIALGTDAVVFAAGVEEIQEVLTECRDALLTVDLLVSLAADPRTTGAAGFVLGRMHAVAQNNALSAYDDFSDAWDRADDGELSGWLG